MPITAADIKDIVAKKLNATDTGRIKDGKRQWVYNWALNKKKIRLIHAYVNKYGGKFGRFETLDPSTYKYFYLDIIRL